MAKSERKQAYLISSTEIEEPTIPHEEDTHDGDIEYGKNNRLLGDWLDKNYRNERTKEIYYSTILQFLRIIYSDEIPKPKSVNYTQLSNDETLIVMNQRKNKIEYFIDKYVADTERVFLDDFKFCILQLNKEKYSPTTINTYTTIIKKFFDRLNPEKYEIKEREMDDIKGTLLPEYVVQTKDEIPTKEELRKIITYLSVKNKALFLFLISTGCRVGAALQLRILDLKVIKDGKIYVDLEPREADIRATYTKGGVGGRTVWFTPETKDAILSWLNIKSERKKRGKGGSFDEKIVFGSSYNSILHSWHRALRKAGYDQRDISTKTKVRKYHIHTLRKFFRTQMGDAGMPDMITHALMGHKAYLSEAYDRPRKLAETYEKYMHAVTIFEKDLETEMREKLAKGEADIQDLEKKRLETKMTLSIIAMNLDISDPHELDSEALLIRINNAIAKIKKTIAGNIEEIAYLKEIGRGSQ